MNKAGGSRRGPANSPGVTRGAVAGGRPWEVDRDHRDLAGLAKAGALRRSIAVFLEWFLRDAYGVKVLASAAFTQGLVSRGVSSLGMG